LKPEKYIAEVTPEGYLSLPESVTERLNLKPYNKVMIIIEKTEGSRGKRKLSEQKALEIKKFISDMGPEDLSEKFREKYK